MTNVVSLVGAQSAAALEPQPKIIEALETILSAAKDGQVQHLVVVYSDGKSAPTDTYQGSGEPGHVAALIGGMELCKQTMLMSQFHEATYDK